MLLADVTSRMGLAAGLMLGGFTVGIYGHMARSRTLILVGNRHDRRDRHLVGRRRRDLNV